MCGGMLRVNHQLPFSDNCDKNIKKALFQIMHSEMHQNFQETVGVMALPHNGRPSVSEETVDNVQTAFQHSPQKSIRRASREFQVPKS